MLEDPENTSCTCPICGRAVPSGVCCDCISFAELATGEPDPLPWPGEDNPAEARTEADLTDPKPGSFLGAPGDRRYSR
jgi:hypothetical protein